MNLLVNFATEAFFPAQRLNSETGKDAGGFDAVYSANPSLIDDQFKERHHFILSQPRGAGYWLWKPYFILKGLDQLQDGDYLMYADAASYFIGSAKPLLELTATFHQDIIPFELEQPESEWAKRDAYHFMNADQQGFEKSRQFLASFIVIRKSPGSVNFIKQYLEYCCNPNILTDLENVCGLENYPGFRGHRHDQSVFSLLCKKHGLQSFRDPSQWGNNQTSRFSNSNYPQILEHTRQPSPKEAGLPYKIKRFLFPK